LTSVFNAWVDDNQAPLLSRVQDWHKV
jgi:hypothetical protein